MIKQVSLFSSFLVFCFSSTCLCLLAHGVESSFTRLLRHILSASSSLDLCIFAFSHMDLSRAVCMLHRRGVTVRVIVDKDYVAITGSQIGVLRKAGEGKKMSSYSVTEIVTMTKHPFAPPEIHKCRLRGTYLALTEILFVKKVTPASVGSLLKTIFT